MDTVNASLPFSVSPDLLASLIGSPEAPLLLDVRRAAPFAASAWMLAGARHCLPEEVAAFATQEVRRPVVTYCVFGHGVGSEAAATLRAAGWDARWLQGGLEGGEDGVDAPEDIRRWRAVALPRMRKRPDLGIPGGAPSRWITRVRPKVDRVACAWLIRRFLDPRARIVYAPGDRVLAEAEHLGAVPFDVEGAPIGHRWERCSFDALLEAFELRAPGLDTLAAIVRGADTSRLEITPQSGGLLALALGMAARHDDDQALLDAAMPMYDALYAWCARGQGEKHGWRAHEVAAA